MNLIWVTISLPYYPGLCAFEQGPLLKVCHHHEKWLSGLAVQMELLQSVFYGSVFSLIFFIVIFGFVSLKI